MVVWDQEADRRKYQRIPIKTGVFAVIGPKSSQKCIVLDISIGGLSFRYYEGAEKLVKEIGDDKLGKIEIKAVGKDFHLKNIPFKSIYDHEVQSEIPYDSLKIRKRGVVFENLTRQQKSKLEGFISNQIS
jgi:hypothetical protein